MEKPFSDQNMAASPRLQAIRNLYDFVDNHSYFAHPTFIGPNKTILQTGIDGTRYNQSYPVGLCDLGLIGAIGTAITPDYRSAAEKLPKETAALLDTGYNFPADHGSLPVFDAQQEDLLLQMQKKGILKPEWYDAERGIFRSSTGQIELDR